MCFVFQILYQYPLEYESTESFDDERCSFLFCKLYAIANAIQTEKGIGWGRGGAIPVHEAISIVQKYNIQETFPFSVKKFLQGFGKSDSFC